MKLTLHLIAGLPGQDETTAAVAGDVLTVNGVAYDLSSVPDGGRAEATGEHPFAGPIARIDGAIHAPLTWYYDGASALEDQGEEHPIADIANGPVRGPVTRKPVLEDEL